MEVATPTRAAWDTHAAAARRGGRDRDWRGLAIDNGNRPRPPRLRSEASNSLRLRPSRIVRPSAGKSPQKLTAGPRFFFWIFCSIIWFTWRQQGN